MTRRLKRPRPYDNSWLGNMNVYITMSVQWKRRKVSYNGTTLGLVQSLLKAGAKDGDTFKDSRGRTRRLYKAPNDPRVGYWVTEWNTQY